MSLRFTGSKTSSIKLLFLLITYLIFLFICLHTKTIVLRVFKSLHFEKRFSKLPWMFSMRITQSDNRCSANNRHAKAHRKKFIFKVHESG